MSGLKYGAHHVTCFVASRGRQPKTINTREKTGGVCTDCGAPIPVGTLFCFSRNNDNKGAGHRPAAAPVVDTDEGDDATADTVDAPAPSVKLPATASPLGAMIAAEILPYLDGKIKASSVSREQIEAIVRECMSPVTRVEIVTPDGATKDMGVQHCQFPELLTLISSGVNVWIAGPAGSGKTTAVHKAAVALGKAYRYSGSVSDAYALLGYNDAQGRYVRTQCREAYEHGGVFLLDEVDGCDPNAVLAVNAMLANGCAAFPDGMIERHPLCTFVATANTWGSGANAEYVGRNKLDGAFLDRFLPYLWNYDQDLETATSGNPEVARKVQSIRAKVLAKGLRHMVTPRATYNASALVSVGVTLDRAIELAVRRGLADDVWSQVSR